MSTPLYGPRLSSSVWYQMEDPRPKLKEMWRQAALAMRFLHENQICHGDLYRLFLSAIRTLIRDRLPRRQHFGKA